MQTLFKIYSPPYLCPVKFTITPMISGRLRTFEVEKIETTNTTETYLITAGDHSITLQNNRLLFRSKNLKSRKGWWKVLAGQFKTDSAREAICLAIEKADPEVK